MCQGRFVGEPELEGGAIQGGVGNPGVAAGALQHGQVHDDSAS